MDFPGHDELQAARAALGGAGFDRPQLQAAAEHVWRAMFYRDEWPAALQEHADALQPVLFKHGTIAVTVATSDQRELTELHRALSEFIEAADDLAD